MLKVSLLKEVKTEVAINFYGVAVGRNGKVGWMVLFLQDTLVCLDVLVLEKLITPFWKILGQELFSNKRITKVAYNTRFIADYLYHNHSIQLVNIYDLQVFFQMKPVQNLVSGLFFKFCLQIFY